MEERESNVLGTAPIGRLMLKLAVPAVAAQFINMLYNIVDRIYIGHIPEVGDLALTGVGVTFPIITLVSAFAAFAGQGGAPLAAISYDPKVTGFMAYLGQEHCMELADVTKPALCRLVEDTMQAAQPYSTDRLKTLAAENETAARELLEEPK